MRIVVSFVYVAMVSLLLVVSMVFAGGGDSGGGTTFSKDTGKTLDSSTFESVLEPRRDFARVLETKTFPALDRLYRYFPDLAEDLQEVLYNKIWWETSQPLQNGRSADARIKDAQELLIDQDKVSVLVSKELRKKSLDEQSTALLHEGVRYIAMKSNLELDDRAIQLVTKMIENVEQIGPGMYVHLKKAGFPTYNTMGQIEAVHDAVRTGLREICSIYKTDVRVPPTRRLKERVNAYLAATDGVVTSTGACRRDGPGYGAPPTRSVLCWLSEKFHNGHVAYWRGIFPEYSAPQYWPSISEVKKEYAKFCDDLFEADRALLTFEGRRFSSDALLVAEVLKNAPGAPQVDRRAAESNVKSKPETGGESGPKAKPAPKGGTAH